MATLSPKHEEIVTTIATDIRKNKRAFLSQGERCTTAEIRRHALHPILADGLDFEDSALINSTLPKAAKDVYLAPLDKGLSGSKVYAARYMTEFDRPSKFFVLKIGDIHKIEEEAHIVGHLVSPFIQSISGPVFRKGPTRALLAQEYAGQGDVANLTSLRNYTRDFGNSGQVIEDLFVRRLAPWYLGYRHRSMSPWEVDLEMRQWNLNELLGRYLKKGPKDATFYPSDWSELPNWVEEITGFTLGNVLASINVVKEKTIETPVTIIHGDLHAQNILVGHHGDCWPIDFAWSTENSSPIIDLVMLECSLKYLVMPWSSSLRSLLKIEYELCTQYEPDINVGNIPWRSEIVNVLSAIKKVREIAAKMFKIKFDDYIRALTLMTFSQATHPHLNRPYILGSIQIMIAIEERLS